MDQSSKPTFPLQRQSKALKIINPDTGEQQPAPVLLDPASSFQASQYTNGESLSIEVDNPKVVKSEKASTPPLKNIEQAFNIYARSFVPQTFTVVNTLPGHVMNTTPMRRMDFENYVRSSIGLQSLSPMPAPAQGPMHISVCLVDTVTFQDYELYFRHHLEAEIRTQQQENEVYSLYGHECAIAPSSNEVVLSFLVPGLRENSPYVEEDDIIQLRQLRYDTLGRPFGMEEWMALKNHLRGKLHSLAWRGDPAPGWTGIIYNARVSVVQRKEERLLVRVGGLTVENVALYLNPHLKFNIQFPVPMDRYLPMKQVLSIIQEALKHTNKFEGRSQDTTVKGAQKRFKSTPLHSKPHEYSYAEPTSKICRAWVQSMLFPIKRDSQVQTILNPGSFKRQFIDEKLNWEQKKAIESVCSQNYGTLPFLISGPPGTGKTKTLVETALQLLTTVDKVSHILFCAPSEPAADMIIQRISANFKQFELLRLNRPTRAFSEVPGAVLPFCYVSGNTFDVPPFPKLMSYKLVVTTCRDAAILLYSRLTNLDLYTAEYGLRSTIHPYAAPPSRKELHWTALLVDESAQAIESEALIPLCVIAPPEGVALEFTPIFVMAGDEHQLGPRTSLRSSPLRTSLFARLFSRAVYAEHPLARGRNGKEPPALNRAMLPIARPAFVNLIRNYRSHPAILAVPSALFYADTLVPEATDTDRLNGWSKWKGRGWPVLLHSNCSEDDLEKDGGGWYNLGEARIACEYASLLVQTQLVEQKEICIMSPFKAQVAVLRNTIRQEKFGSLWDVDIGPTEAFQGLERGVVILCTTRSKHRFVESDKGVDWGIIGLPNKMNVALTRAKFGLIVVGKIGVLSQDPNWNVFLEFCKRNGLTTGKTCPKCKTTSNSQDNGKDETVKLTRLEKILFAKEQDLEEPLDGDRTLKVMSQDDEMWTHGMQTTLDDEIMSSSEVDEEEDDEYNDEYQETEGQEGQYKEPYAAR